MSESTVINFTEARRRLTEQQQQAVSPAKQNNLGPAWKSDIHTCCAYARLVRAEHEAESARIKFEQLERGITDAWWEGPADIMDRVNRNNLEWDRYIQLLRHMAALPATTRAEGADKRHTIGKGWLSEDCSCPKLFAPLRAGCIADDHLFPRSMKLARA